MNHSFSTQTNQVVMHASTFLTFALVGVIATSVLSETPKKYYGFKINKLNWHAAFQDCLTRGLQLATINSNTEQNSLEATIRKIGLADEWLWTSGTDQGEEGNFFWMSTGEPLTYTKFSPGQPDNQDNREHCLHIWNMEGLTWNDIECSTKLYYICEDKPANNNYTIIDITI